MTEKLGFIGLGVMGGHMARHLSGKYDTIVYDIDAGKRESIEKARKAESITDVAGYADIVLLSLPSSEIVRDVVTGQLGLARFLEPGKTVIDTSTTEPTVSREIAAVLSGNGVDFLDAPVSGGERGAKDAALAFMVGGTEAVFGRCKPIFNVIGKSVVLVGEVGSGGVTKLVNNMIVGATFSVIAESFALGMKNGVDPAVIYAAIKDGWAGSHVLDVAGPGIINQDYTPGGSVDILFKDLGYALSLARSQNVPVPMTAATDEIFKAARSSGRGPYAQQIIIQLWEEMLGIDRNS
ncbi:MAG: NAD-binding protein [Spirochaetales bacterium]|jgi:2-hydroxy-3-oxopropionate reductase|nr:NAD-binding protein [Spirochaetales bacterium]